MKINKYDLEKLESYWRDIKELKKKLKFREWELMNPHLEQDTNIGGGRSSNISDTTFRKAVSLAEDKQYNNLKDTIEAVESIYKTLDEIDKKILDMRYWSEYAPYEWFDIADELRISRSKAIQRRNVIINKTAERLGWF